MVMFSIRERQEARRKIRLKERNKSYLILIFSVLICVLFGGLAGLHFRNKEIKKNIGIQESLFEENAKKLVNIQKNYDEVREGYTKEKEEWDEIVKHFQEVKALVETEIKNRVELIDTNTKLQEQKEEKEKEVVQLTATMAELDGQRTAQKEAARKAAEDAAKQNANGNHLQGGGEGKGKTVYLTFDDGPSYLTPKVLEILDKYQVKATFFVTYQDAPSLVPYYKEIVDRGHTIAIHTASHDYQYIYSSMEAFQADFNKIYNYVEQLTGVKCQLYRFPGGSSTKKNAAIRDNIKAFLKERGMVYHDWNVVTGDGGTVSTQEAYKNVVDNIFQRSHPVILAHDGPNKETTVEALPLIIEQLLAWGYTFEQLTPEVTPIQAGVNW